MAWFFRAVQVRQDQWVCRQGRHEYDAHADLESALAHLRALARGIGEFELFAHSLDGGVLRVDPDTAGEG